MILSSIVHVCGVSSTVRWRNFPWPPNQTITLPNRVAVFVFTLPYPTGPSTYAVYSTLHYSTG